PQPLAGPGQLPVHIRGGVHHATVERVDSPLFEIIPGSRGSLETKGNLTQADDGGTDCLGPVLGEKSPGPASSAGQTLSSEVNQERGVRYHLRPPDRLPLSLSMRSNISGLALGGGSSS